MAGFWNPTPFPSPAVDEHRHEHSDFFVVIRRRRSGWTGRRSIVTASADEFDRDRDRGHHHDEDDDRQLPGQP
jgi:hypothetical protein